MSTLVVFDFDNTLFRTRQFWRERLFPAYAQEMGIDQERMEEVFVVSTTGAVDYFLPRRFFEELARIVPADAMEQAKQVFNRVVFSTESRDYLTDGAQEVVEMVRAKGDAIRLISYGDPEFKSAWFDSLGLTGWFSQDEVLITPQKKSLLVGDLPTADETLFLDDSLSELAAFLETSALQGRIARGVLYDPTGTHAHGAGIVSLKELRMVPDVLTV